MRKRVWVRIWLVYAAFLIGIPIGFLILTKLTVAVLKVSQ